MQSAGSKTIAGESDPANCAASSTSEDRTRHQKDRSPRKERRESSPRSSSKSTRKGDAQRQDADADVDERWEYFDLGSHWCRLCNVTVDTLAAFLTHLHSAEHRAVSENY